MYMYKIISTQHTSKSGYKPLFIRPLPHANSAEWRKPGRPNGIHRTQLHHHSCVSNELPFSCRFLGNLEKFSNRTRNGTREGIRTWVHTNRASHLEGRTSFRIDQFRYTFKAIRLSYFFVVFYAKKVSYLLHTS